MLKGYNGKMLFVNLTDKSIEEKELTEEMASKFIGGYGIGAKVLYDNMPAKADPLGEESMIGFMTGPTSGTKAFFGGRYTVVNKSPVTGGWNDANSGGFFGPELKKAGFDALFVKGISKEPVYIWINEGKVEIKDASKQWGMNSKETLKSLKEELGEDKLRVSCIGPAGENLSNIAAIMNDEHRAAGRGGCGTVMGSKKLKAVAVRGTKKIEVADPNRIVELNKKVSATMKENPMAQAFGAYGTGSGTEASALNGDSPVKNWGGVGVVDYGEEKAKKISVPTYDKKYNVKKYNCANCPLGCGAKYKVDDGRWPVGDTDRPEYETQAAFGSAILNDDTDALFKCNEICNTYGIDTISAGMTIAWAMECFEEGVLTKEDLDGIELTWGNGEAVVAIMEKMANNEGIGKILMKGSMHAAKELGKGEEFLQTASGIELPMHDPKLGPGFARTYQYDPTPGRHVKGGLGMPQMMGVPGLGEKYDYDATGYLDVKLTANQELINSAGFCMFMSIAGAEQGIENQYIEAITGRSFKPQDQDKTGMRILNMRHAFNLREGLTPKDFTITKRALGQPPQKEGPVADVEINDKKLRDNFFSFIGWDLETGKPSKEALEKLELDFLIKDLY
jgi:aldehyde:ferredoxin oxidoreductase